MKIRIKGNSVRLRLSKSEVKRLVVTGQVTEKTAFGDSHLHYAIEVTEKGDTITAVFRQQTIIISIATALVQGWENNSVVGFDAHQPLKEGGTLYLLVEKDFVCMDATNEDQADNYENPNKTC